MRIGVLQLDDVRLGFEYKEGAGVPLVFMGGVTSTTATWEPVFRTTPKLTARYIC